MYFNTHSCICALAAIHAWGTTHLLSCSNEPRHDKTDKMSVRPAKIQISLGIRPVWSESSLSAWRKLGSLATHWAHSEDSSVWADAQADLSLRWAQSHFVGFVMSRFKYCTRSTFIRIIIAKNRKYHCNCLWKAQKILKSFWLAHLLL